MPCLSAARFSLPSLDHPDYFKRTQSHGTPQTWCTTTASDLDSPAAAQVTKWEFEVDGRPVEYEVSGNLTISDSLFPVEAALEGSHWRPHSSNSRFPSEPRS